MSIEAIVGIVGVLVSIVGIYFGAKAKRVVVVHEEKETDGAKQVERPRPHGLARVFIGLGVLLSLGGMGIFMLVVVNAFTSVTEPGEPGSFELPSFELLGPAIALFFAGLVFNVLGRFFSGKN